MTRRKQALLTLAGITAFCMFSFTSPQDEQPQSGPNWLQDIIVASTGTIDEKDTREVEFRTAIARIKPGLDSGKAVLRYDVYLDLKGSFVQVDQLHLFVRYRDNGTGSRVVAKLKAYDAQTGATDTLLIFDSNSHNSQSGFRRGTVGISGNGIGTLDPLEAYFVEVTLTKQEASGKPELGSIEVWVLPSS